MPMTSPRFRAAGTAPVFIGEANSTKPSTTEGSVIAGDVVAGTKLIELDSGEEWYYDGSDWKKVVTVHTRILAELAAMRQVLERIAFRLEQQEQPDQLTEAV